MEGGPECAAHEGMPRTVLSMPQTARAAQEEGDTTGVRHYFDTAVARECGVNAAVVFENLAFWIRHNAQKGQNEREGAFWTYATQKAIADQFDYLTPKQTRLALEKLIAAELIQTGRFNRHGYDKTTWYALTAKGEAMSRAGQDARPKKAAGAAQKGRPIPDRQTTKKNQFINERIQNYANSPFDF